MEGRVPKGKILLTVLDKGEQTKNGIIVPSFETKQKEGLVEIGGEQTKEGDVIIYTTNGVNLTIDDTPYVLIKENEVLFIK